MICIHMATDSEGQVGSRLDNQWELSRIQIAPIQSFFSNPKEQVQRKISATRNDHSAPTTLRSHRCGSEKPVELGHLLSVLCCPEEKWRCLSHSGSKMIKRRKFKMETLKSLTGMQKRDHLSSIDLSEAYLCVSVRESHRSFFCFAYNGKHYQYWALPFGLKSPRIFTTIFVNLIAYLYVNSFLIPIPGQHY